VKIAIATGVMLGYALQFFVAIQIMFPNFETKFHVAKDHPLLSELAFRTFWVAITFIVAIAVPELDLLLSLIGSVCSTVLALVFPIILECVIDEKTSTYVIVKNVIIFLIALLGFLTGGMESISAIIQNFLH
jgi:proton-coupled amino acid transporter